MKRSVIFMFIVFFAAIMLAGFITGIKESSYGRACSFVGQAGLGISLLLFFICRNRKNTGPRDRQ